jgi:CSLREA domain-containing protein
MLQIPRRTRLVSALLALAWLGGAWCAQAKTIVVDTTSDLANVSDAHCSLREALNAANLDVASANPGECAPGDGPDTIAFNIPGTGPHTIVVASTMPFIQTPIRIDGLTQPGSTCPDGLRVEIAPATATQGGTVFMFLQGSSGSLLRGLAIQGFDGPSGGYGAQIATGSAVVVQCNLFGLHADGSTAAGNQYGVYVHGPAAAVIGTDGDGAGDALEGNVFANSKIAGMTLGSVDGLVIAGNRFGVDTHGLAAPNNGGIYVPSFSCPVSMRIGSNLDGVSDALEANWIANNKYTGVAFAPCGAAYMRGNRFEANGGAGYNPFGGTAADDPDVDGLPNAPVLSAVVIDAANHRARASVQVPSAPANVAYPLVVDLYIADLNDQEGMTWIGSLRFHPADFAAGGATRALALDGPVPVPGDAIVALSTTSASDTSAFSAPVLVTMGAVESPLLDDGFESGNYVAWSAKVPAL